MNRPSGQTPPGARTHDPARFARRDVPIAAHVGLDLDRYANLGDALADAIPPNRTRTALIEADRHRETSRSTYNAYAEASTHLQASMQSCDVKAGDRVAILLSNQHSWLTSATAALWAGAVLTPLDYKLDADAQAELLAHAAPRVLITEWATWRKLSAHAARFAETTTWVMHAPASADLGGATRFESLPRLSAEDAAALERVPRERGDVACLVYSSGTGGRVKGCQLTHHNYLVQAQALSALFPMTREDRYFSILPTNHAIDFMCGFLIPLLSGASVVHQRTLRPEFLRWTMKRYEPTHMALVPALLKRLKQRLEERLEGLGSWQRALVDGLIRANEVATLKRPNHRLSRALLRPIHEEFGGRLRLLFAGGAFVDPSVASFFYKLGLPVCIGYGLTEAGTVLTVNRLEPFRPDTVGRPIEGVTLEIRDPDEEGVGEVWAQSETVFAGYLDDEELTREALVDGWLRTGDRGRIDAAGHLKLLGRTRNMIVTPGGKNIYPEDIESAFEGVDGVGELCVFASSYVWPGEALTEEALIAVVRYGAAPSTSDTPEDDDGDAKATPAAAEAALRACNQRLPEHKRVLGVLVWPDAFPRTASMKVKRGALAEAIRGAAARGDVTPWTGEGA